MGSNEIWNLQYRQAFAFVGMTGGMRGPNEKRGNSQLEEVCCS